MGEPTAREWAREVAHAIIGWCHLPLTERYHTMSCDRATDHALVAIEADRAATIEACAMAVAEVGLPSLRDVPTEYAVSMLRDRVSRRILSLKERP